MEGSRKNGFLFILPKFTAYPAPKEAWGVEGGIFCVIGAMVGAGFASGREIMAFFSRFGAYSWGLIALCSAGMTVLLYRIMAGAESVQGLLPDGRGQSMGRAVWLLLFSFTGGAMLSAAGELAALTMPLPCARWLGGGLTLLMCCFAGERSLSLSAGLGKCLLPLLLLALLLCRRVRGTTMATPAFSALAVLDALGYGGLNVTLAAQMICEIGKGKSRQEKRSAALQCGAALGALLLLANSVLMRHGEAKDAALPVVVLLRDYGKEGFYLSAALLYLAVVTTLISQLRGLKALLPPRHGPIASALLVSAASLLGFQGIVGKAYPLLGWAAMGIAFYSVGKKRYSASFTTSSRQEN